MSVNGVGGVSAPLLRPQESAARPRVEQDRTAQAAALQTPSIARPAGTGLLAPRQDALPVEAPAGTDPELWQMLTPAERAYFAKTASMGPLTYGRPSVAAAAAGSSREAPAVRGGRIDIRA